MTEGAATEQAADVHARWAKERGIDKAQWLRPHQTLGIIPYIAAALTAAEDGARRAAVEAIRAATPDRARILVNSIIDRALATEATPGEHT